MPDNLPWDQTGRENKLPVSRWIEWGVTDRDGKAFTNSDVLKAGLVLPMGHKGPAFLVFDNYDVYLQWNQSGTYTLTAANLAYQLAGAPPFEKRLPIDALSFEEMKDLQTKLEARGYNVGSVDGILGTNTREAVRQEQMRLGLIVDGWPTSQLLGSL